MSTTEDTTKPLVEALQRKTNYQAERIDDLEDTIVGLEATVEMLQNELAEADE